MRRPDRGTLRAAAFTTLLVIVFLTVNTSVAQAADSATGSGGLLSPLQLNTSEGVSLEGYELGAQSGSVFAFPGNMQVAVLGGLFTVVQALAGLACWAIEVAYRFPLLKLLTKPAQHLSEAYTEAVVDDLGLKAALLAWAFVFGLVLVMRGKYVKGFGEIFLTLVIGALAASVFVTPNFLLGKEGPVLQAQSAAADVAQLTVNSHTWGGKVADNGPCAGMAGFAEQKCMGLNASPDAKRIARPIQDAVTNSLVVKPFMLLQYGRILDPGKRADRKAYAVHLKWVAGGYGEQKDKKKREGEDYCDLIKGPAKAYCEREPSDKGPDTLPELTPGGELLDAVAPVLSEDDQEFAAFLKDLKKAGPVGKECADYAAKPSWWRVASVVMVFIAALLICALLLSAAMVLLGISAVCAGAAAGGGVAFVWGMLPGPSRTVVWKWIALFGISMAAILAIATFIPAVGITMDVILTDGPDLLAERLLLIDVLAVVGVAFHRRLLVLITSFGQRLTLRMRYANIGGSHLAGDSQLGAALAMSIGNGASSGALGGGSLRGRGLTGLGMGTGSLLQGVGRGLLDGTGMPGDPGRLLADANAEVSRGLAPIGLAVAGARIAAGGAWSALVGKRPDDAKLAKRRKPTAGGSDPDDAQAENGHGPNGNGSAGGPGGRINPNGPQAGGPSDRYRNADGQIVNPSTGEVLHDQNDDRTLLSTRAHNRLVRLRAYRVTHTGGRALYGATMGLAATARTMRSGTSNATQDTRQQLRVWSNTLRQDGQAWGSMLQTASAHLTPSGRRLSAPASHTTSTPRASATAGSALSSTSTSVAATTAGAASGPSVSWAQATVPSGPAVYGPRPRPAGPSTRTPSASLSPESGGGSGSAAPSSGPAAGPAPAGSTGRVTRPQPRLSGGLGSSTGSRSEAREMFRRIQENNLLNGPRHHDGGEDE
ncbi:hypothetical protein [Streptomyces sp. NPDC050145]|uniref:hypothetical protein n=1 Tax=Streptomyces sp. NPDC050145 TaxID=3365602 RepID=UPI0037A3B975